MERSKEQHLLEKEIFYNVINVTFDQLNALLLNKRFKNLADPNLLNGSVISFEW